MRYRNTLLESSRQVNTWRFYRAPLLFNINLSLVFVLTFVAFARAMAEEPKKPVPLPIEQRRVVDYAKAEDICSVTKLPETGVFRQEQAEGMFWTLHYPDPRALPSDYTGCLQIWMEVKGQAEVFTVGRFEGGAVRAIRIPAMNIECAYDDSKLKKTGSPSERQCPPTTNGMELRTWQK